MEHFNEYWELFDDKKDSIAKEIIAYYKTLDDHEDGTELSEQCRRFFHKNMIQNPYPTCQLLKLLAMSKIPSKNSILYEIATAAMLDVFGNAQQQVLDSNKCYNVLANSLVSVKATSSLRKGILKALDRKTVDIELLMLAIFARKSVKLLVHLLPDMVTALEQKWVWEALEKKQHFFHALLQQQNPTSPCYKQHSSYISFIEHVRQANYASGAISTSIETVSLLPSDKAFLVAYLLEMQRCWLLNKALSLHNELLSVKDLSQHETVSSVLIRAKVNMSELDFVTLLAVARTNQALNEQIMSLTKVEPPIRQDEIMTLLQMQTIIAIYRAIEASASTQEHTLSSNNLDTQLKSLLKETNMETFMQTMEVIFTMLFVRGELLATDANIVERKNFLCSPSVLTTLTSSMKSILITRKHSTSFRNADEPMTQRFQTLFELVTDVSWRLSLFNEDSSAAGMTPHDSKCTRPVHLTDMVPVPTALTHITENYCESSTTSTGAGMLFRSVESIDVSIGHRHRFGYYRTLPKQKSSRRHPTRQPLTATGSSNSGGSNKELPRQSSFSINTKSESTPIDRAGVEADLAVRSIRYKTSFTKLFATPEKLAIVCLINSKMSYAKTIIDNHNLYDRPVGRLVQRIEQMLMLKNRLTVLVAKNERKQDLARGGYGGSQSSDSNSDVLLDDIRLKTAMGFEISKVLSLIETYLKSLAQLDNTLATVCILAPMDRFVPRYPFLSVFTEKNMQLSQIVDIVLNLPFTYELNLAIYNFLQKNAHHMASMASNMMSTSTAGHGGETSQLIGNYVYFFGTIIDTLQLLHKTRRAEMNLENVKLTIEQLLSREVCPLDTVENSVVLKRRARFHNMVDRGDELEHSREDPDGSFTKLSESGSASLGKVRFYLGHMTKLMQLLVPTAATDDLLANAQKLIKTDVRELILQRLLEGTVSSSTMDTLSSMLGVNLIQTICMSLIIPTTKGIEVDGLWEYIESKSELLYRLCRVQVNGTEVCNDKPSLIVNYATLKNDADHLEGCRYLRSCEVFDLPAELFPLQRSFTCCMLQKLPKTDHEKMLEADRIAGDVFTMEQKALVLLAGADGFAIANEWISASEHLLTTVQKNVNEERSLITPAARQSLQQKANELKTYLCIATMLQLSSTPTDDGADYGDGWRCARKFSTENSSTVLHQLIELGEYRVCKDWIKLHPIDADKELEMFMYAIHKVTAETMPVTLQNNDAPIVLLFRIIETMPSEAVVKLYETLMLNIRSIPVVSYMLGYLQCYAESKPLYQKYTISLQIFHHLTQEEYEGLWNLASRPLLIIEQCLMNSRLELLTAVVRSIRELLVTEVCTHCYEHREYIRDLHDAVQGSGIEGQHTSTTLLSRYPVHDGLYISHECVDCLLRVYAGKALEYKVFTDLVPSDARNDGSGHPLTAASRVSSYDSLSEVAQPFVMPKEIPSREYWIKDEDALHCMCCRRAFSMLNRRHHCRRCGRVVCHSCSKRKLRLHDFYEDVAVRVCDDCWRNLVGAQPKDAPIVPGMTAAVAQPSGSSSRASESDSQFEWQMTGNERYDNVIRDEYSYEYAPSTGQCLAICNLHTPNEEVASFLLYHCAKLETLLRPLHPGVPNPEIDYALVARMLLNLTLGVKVRGGGAEVEKMKEHAEIILSIVHDNCESLLLHTPSMSNHGTLRKLRDALLKAEKWTLALELSLKCGFSLNGVMAAWGMACLRAGCYETAREKFSHCLPRVANDAECKAALRMIETPPSPSKKVVPVVKRPTRSPPLLHEILYALTYTAPLSAPSECVIARVNAARQAPSGIGTGAASHEPALNILSTLANLRNICQGEFDTGTFSPNTERVVLEDHHSSIMCSQLFEESMHYLLAYGSHQSVVQFLIRYQKTESALRYILAQHVDPDVFLQTILLPFLQRGALELIVQRLSDIDDTLLEWRDYIRYTCRYLEMNDMLNSLYSLQLLLKDPIRASMTCVRFYTMGCLTFSDLLASEHHLKTSVTHLQNELELCNWQEVRLNSTGTAIETHHSLLMKLDPKELNNHINTILLQLDVTKFLATCESKGRQTNSLLSKIVRDASQLPTLFGSSHDKLQLAILTLVCGQNVEEAFGLSYRIIQDYNLDMQRVYALTAKYFINHGKIEDVSKLLGVIVSNESSAGSTEPAVSPICDEIVRVSVDVAIARHGIDAHTKVALEALISRASSVAVRIHCYIVSGQLKAAYLLANRHQRTGDIRKIWRQAEMLGQMHLMSKYSSLIELIFLGEQHGMAEVLSCITCVCSYLGRKLSMHSPAQ
uniref:FYVE-type domain-containing protein n=1 Tax=Anopheles dirus TaxID=7168 RepID=A0A182N240_9DIPT